jgi:hypothetical protein
MHGLINRSVQCFLRDTYGTETWQAIAAAAGVPPDGFEPLLRYEDGVTLRLIDAAAERLSRPRESLLEDLGTYLVSHPNREGLRRLLRFGGVGFLDFLHSIDDLPGRGRLAVPHLDLPQLELTEEGAGRFLLACRAPHPAFATVMIGVLRAMADDYGALALLEPAGRGADGAELIAIDLLDQSFAEGRSFDLAAGMG